MTEKNYNNSLGLWLSTDKKTGKPKLDKNGKRIYSGRLPDGEYYNLFINSKKSEAKHPDLNLVLPDGYEIAKIGSVTLDQLPRVVAQGDEQSRISDDDIPF